MLRRRRWLRGLADYERSIQPVVVVEPETNGGDDELRVLRAGVGNDNAPTLPRARFCLKSLYPFICGFMWCKWFRKTYETATFRKA